MKKIVFLILLIIFIGCKKEEKDTTYQVKNNCGITLDNIYSYYYSDGQKFDIVNHGTLMNGQFTDKITTKREYINVMFTMLGHQYKVVSPYNIESSTNNILTIESTTIVQEVK